MSEFAQLYQDAIASMKRSSLLSREEKTIPEEYIVATHGPALTKAITENPELLNLIGIFRVNCSHLGKEPDFPALAEYLSVLHRYVPILIDLQ